MANPKKAVKVFLKYRKSSGEDLLCALRFLEEQLKKEIPEKTKNGGSWINWHHSSGTVCLRIPPKRQSTVFATEAWKDFLFAEPAIDYYHSASCGWDNLCHLSGYPVAAGATPRRAA